MFSEIATLVQLQARFRTEEDCANYLFEQKWPHGFVCSRCSYTTAFRIDSRRLPLYQCGDCRYQASPTVGTIMESSPTDLRKWFTAMFLVSTTDSGINALQLKYMIEVTYKTAWLMLRKIRQSITQADETIQLSGTVFIDKGRCGRPFATTFYSEPNEFPVLIGTATDVYNQPAYVKIQMVSEFDYNDIHILPMGIWSFRERNINSAATVTCTIGTRTKRTAMKGYPIFQKAKIWMKKKYHSLTQVHLKHYWNEFCWRLNTKLQRHPLFESLLELCATTPTSTYAMLIKKN